MANFTRNEFLHVVSINSDDQRPLPPWNTLLT